MHQHTAVIIKDDVSLMKQQSICDSTCVLKYSWSSQNPKKLAPHCYKCKTKHGSFQSLHDR